MLDSAMRDSCGIARNEVRATLDRATDAHKARPHGRHPRSLPRLRGRERRVSAYLVRLPFTPRLTLAGDMVVALAAGCCAPSPAAAAARARPPRALRRSAPPR